MNLEKQPTAADFEALEARSRAYDSLDRERLDVLRRQWHLALPQPYEQAVAELDLTDLGVVHALQASVEQDSALGNEERYALGHAIGDRARTAVLKTAPEGWND